MSGSKFNCGMCGSAIEANGRLVSCDASCARVFHADCVVGAGLLTARATWHCHSCRSLSSISEECESSTMSFSQAPKPPSAWNAAKMENLTNAVEFLGGQIDIFNKIVCKFRKKLEDVEKTNRALKEENVVLKESLQSLGQRLEALEAEKSLFQPLSGLSEVDLPLFGPVDTSEESPSPEESGVGLPDRDDFVARSLTARSAFFIPEIQENGDPAGASTPTPDDVILPGLPPGFSFPIRSSYLDAPDEVDGNVIMFCPPEVKPLKAVKKPRKTFGNIVARLMAEEYLSGANRYKADKPPKPIPVPASLPRAPEILKTTNSAPSLIENSIVRDPPAWLKKSDNASKWGHGSRNVVARMMALEFHLSAAGVPRTNPEDPSLGVVPGAGEMSSDPYRNRYGQLNSYTWGSHTAALREHERRQKAVRGDVVYHTVTGAVSQGSQRQHQVPSIFEIFRPRSKSDAASKKPLVGSAKNSLKSQGSTSSEGGEHSRGPVAKVIHLFRNRSQSAASAEEKRKARAAALHQQQVAAHSAARRNSIERRLSLGTTGTLPGGHRGSDPLLDPNHAAILFRDSRGLPVADPFLEKVSMSDLEDESQIFVKFFKFHRCYGLIPTSAKLVVFDTQLLVKKAFFALVYNGVRAAPLWDSKEHKFVGMLTITDFIKILQKFHSSDSMSLDQMEEHKLDTWRSLLKDESVDLISIGPDASLYEAIKMLIHNRVHRLPVIDPDTGNVLYILTHKRILRFLFLYMNDLPRPSFLNKSLGELRIGTFDLIETATEQTTIIDALDKFVERRISALPIVDDQKRLVDIFAKFDVINLAAEKTYDKLDMTIKEANEHRNDWFEGVHKCSMDDTLYAIIEKIVRAEVHRLVVTDDEDKVIGVLSLSDLLQYLVLRPCGEEGNSRPMTPISEIAGANCASEETILEGEEDEEEEAQEADALSREPTPPLHQPSWREVAVTGGE